MKICKLEELEKYRYIAKIDLKKTLKSSKTKFSSINYIAKNLINDLKNIDIFEEKIMNMNNNIISIIDKIELRVMEMLIICFKAKDFVRDNFKEYELKLENMISNSFDIFSIKFLICIVFLILYLF